MRGDSPYCRGGRVCAYRLRLWLLPIVYMPNGCSGALLAETIPDLRELGDVEGELFRSLWTAIWKSLVVVQKGAAFCLVG